MGLQASDPTQRATPLGGGVQERSPPNQFYFYKLGDQGLLGVQECGRGSPDPLRSLTITLDMPDLLRGLPCPIGLELRDVQNGDPCLHPSLGRSGTHNATRVPPFPSRAPDSVIPPIPAPTKRRDSPAQGVTLTFPHHRLQPRGRHLPQGRRRHFRVWLKVGAWPERRSHEPRPLGSVTTPPVRTWPRPLRSFSVCSHQQRPALLLLLLGGWVGFGWGASSSTTTPTLRTQAVLARVLRGEAAGRLSAPQLLHHALP